MKKIDMNAGKVICVSLFWLYLINIIFLLGWMHLWIAIPACIIVSIGYVHARKVILEKCRYYVSFSFGSMFLLCIFILIVVWVSGIGVFFPQCYDYVARNPIYRDLILHQWPVLYTDTNRALCYYFGYWLLPALLSKILFFRCSEYIIWQGAQIILYVYTVIICLLICILICVLIKQKWQKYFSLKDMAKMIFVFGAWGGVPIGGYFALKIFGIFISEIHSFIEGISLKDLWNSGIALEHYANGIAVVNGNITQLANVFNQTLPAWMATAIFLILIDEITVYAYVGFMILICAPYPVIGLGMMMASVFLKKIIGKQINRKEVFSVSNLCSIPLLLTAVLFYHKTVDSNLHLVVKEFYKNHTLPVILLGVLVVAFFAFGIYTILLDKEQKNYLLYASQIVFIGCYFVGFGSATDLTMRAIIPIYFYFMILVMRTIFSTKVRIHRKYLLACVLAISGVIQCNLIFTLLEKGAEYGTLQVPFDTVYTFSNNYGINDNVYIEQYTKLNCSADLFFGKMCRGSCEITKPVIEYAVNKQKNNSMYVKKVSIKKEYIKAFVKSVVCDDEAALEKRLQKKCAKSDDSVVVHFEENEVKPRIESNSLLSDDNFNLNWTNYNASYHSNKMTILANVELEYKGEDPIQICYQTNSWYESGISCALYDEEGKLVRYPWAYTYTKHVIYNGQKEKYILAIPKPENCGKYKLVMMFFSNQNQVYSVYAQREYLLEFK